MSITNSIAIPTTAASAAAAAITSKPPLIHLDNVAKTFRASDGTVRSVLENVQFSLQEGEIVALLGKSGSGKSTLLRIMAGLIPADRGSARYRGNFVRGPVGGIAMVFQSFALFPWLTVQQNVELGLEAQGVNPDERERRADAMLELIGLAGFGGALPRELSGGMKQRVGIARALVTNPDVLLMDEAFSALDVLTGETLRNDILELWEDSRIPTKGILVVSHNIEEAVVMADRIMVLSSDPGRIRNEIRIDLPRPRDVESAEVRALIDEVYGLMTMRATHGTHAGAPSPLTLGYRLPDTDISRMEGVLDMLAVAPFDGHADLPQLAEEAELSDDELFPACEALGLLGMAHIDKGDITLTAIGREYAQAEQPHRHEIFGQQLLQNVPLAAHIRRELETEPDDTLREEDVLTLLRELLKPEEAQRVLDVAIEWGRYGEVYEYDYHAGALRLPEGEDEESGTARS